MIKSLVRLIHEPIYKKRIDVLSTLIVQQLRARDKILDIGCGSGMLGARYWGTGIAPMALLIADWSERKEAENPLM